MTRILGFLIAILVGIVAGLAVGWLVVPPSYANTTPDTLRSDYKADVVLMAAESYQADKNLDQAVQRLALLGTQQAPVVVAQQAVIWANQAGYASDDLKRMTDLAAALQSDIRPVGVPSATPRGTP